MCRNIKPLYNFDPPATEAELHDAALQFVRKLTGMQKPSSTNQLAFDAAINGITAAAQQLFDSLTTTAQPHNRDIEAAKAKLRTARRFGTA